jgi:hypothetical protein
MLHSWKHHTSAIITIFYEYLAVAAVRGIKEYQYA